MKNAIIQKIEDQQKRESDAARVASVTKANEKKKGFKIKETLVPDFQIGDTVNVHQRMLDGDKERLQVFEGVVIAKRGAGLQEMFTVRKIVQGEGVERVFPVASPRIAMIEIKRSGVTRRAKLYYLRDRVGKATRLKEKKAKKVTAAAAAAPSAPATPPAAE